jgi:hypothetical protein
MRNVRRAKTVKLARADRPVVTVRPKSVARETASAHDECKPADFCSLLRHHPLQTRWWFSLEVGSNKNTTAARARHWTKTRKIKQE